MGGLKTGVTLHSPHPDFMSDLNGLVRRLEVKRSLQLFRSKLAVKSRGLTGRPISSLASASCDQTWSASRQATPSIRSNCCERPTFPARGGWG